MSPRLLFTIVFIEGYCSLGAEIVALRRLIPHIGSSIVVTAPTIGLFLLALALGYHSGSRVAADYRTVVARNFLISALLMGAGLAGGSVNAIFAGAPAGLAYLIFIGAILCPLAWLLGQTVPILTNLMRVQRSGEAAGRALYWSTLGSFLGSVTLSLVVMQLFGVWAAVLLGAWMLVAGAALVQRPRPLAAGLLIGAAALSVAANLGDRQRADTAYADYAVEPVAREGMQTPRAFRVNNQVASLIDDSEPPQYARYVQHLRRILLDDLRFKERDVLVLGAGGFTLSHREPLNRYTYVDIDPAIRAIAQRDFLREPARGEFVATDARRFVIETTRRYDAVVVDVYSSRSSIPGHLVTREFWRDTRHALKPGGVMLANLILDGRLAGSYARNLLATIESAYGRCAVEVLAKAATSSNVIVTCFAGETADATRIYVDERNLADIDSAGSP
ncbi:fused MFS/spermidine synthase [Sulfuritalea sp.]|uniref:fused MFS/spermidine synthase n=1 Tax=Sulfuritalea sp. TaxID=2480090 RepID=UPI00286E0E5F|nr:fused MFS/spermidine synthase [Sulfuritalea sp.]